MDIMDPSVVLPLCVLILLELPECIVFGSVILSGGPYCSTDGGSVQHAVPGTVISITCAVDNPSGLNVLLWTIPSYGISVGNINGADDTDDDQPDFVSTVNSFDNNEGTTNATLTFTAIPELDGVVVNCEDVPKATSNCTLYVLTPPSPPTSVMCTNITQTSLTLSWTPPSDDGGEESSLLYEVTRTPPGVVTSLSDALSMESGLHRNTNYSFFVRASTSAGVSNNSDTIFCYTPPWEVFDPVHTDNVQVCLDKKETSNILLINITLQECPPASSNINTTPQFDNFTITVSGFDPVYTNSCLFNQPISVEEEYTITIAINNEGGSSEPTTKQFDASWINVSDSSLKAEYAALVYSIVNCTTVENANVSLTITESEGSIALKDEQPYDPDFTSFDISSLLSNESYNYTLLVIAPSQVTIATYTGELTPTSSIIINSFTSIMNSSSLTPSSTTDSSSVEPIVVGGVVGGLALVFLVLSIVLVAVIIPVYKKSKLKSFSPLKKNSTAIRIHPDNDLRLIEQGKTSPQEFPTYKNPKNIQRQQAPTGEIYTKAQKNKSGLQSGYAELQLQYMGGSEQPSGGVLTVPNEHKPTTGNVMYSVIKRDD